MCAPVVVVEDIGGTPCADAYQKIRKQSCLQESCSVVALLSQLFDGEHGQGFIEATSMNEAGYSVEYFALLILIVLSSSG